MKIRALLLPVMLACLSTFSLAQITTEKGKQSDQVNIKISKLDLLIKLVPLALRKEQYPDLLTGIEKARDLERQALSKEDEQLAALDGDLTAAIDNAVEKGQYPPRTTQDLIAGKIQEMTNARMLVHYKMIKAVSDAIKSKLNAGQIKVIAGSFAPQFIDPSVPKDKMTDEVKIDFFIDRVFLDPLAYDLLLEMAKHAT